MSFARDGWQVFAPESATRAWCDAAHAAALAAVNDPAMANWHQCEGTWFVGLEALPNDAQGRVNGSAPLSRVPPPNAAVGPICTARRFR